MYVHRLCADHRHPQFFSRPRWSSCAARA